ncbi:uncharacterized protein STEHIDRAFT_129239 [Stereum hirsutum FP-91666 SS1]|uniref:uncharacterized protein n=1 Tax=Stereum hirsutum (strain FP-91666) TaxID=721885 RepID=UPI000440CC1F|nr:uncharacterized protein STEHIDRAFT_129239 [Stereum hirsutum FP-91666 SS1]EIM90387.1 hypothetical protein STEHIDRAFT_129239 [Stereum hirsutum FP-91666 SS1]
MSGTTAESLITVIGAVITFVAYISILQYPVIWYRLLKYGGEGISVPTQLILALSYLTFYFLPLLGPSPSILSYFPPFWASVIFIFFFVPFPLYTLYLLHIRSLSLRPASLSPSEKFQYNGIMFLCLVLSLTFNYKWYGWGARLRIVGGQGSWGLGWLYEILWAFGTYSAAMGVWPQLIECEREGREALIRDPWLMAYLGLLFFYPAMRVLGALVGLTLQIWDPLAFYSSLFTTLLFTYYFIKIFIIRTSAPSLSLPTFSSSSAAPRRRNQSWNWPWKRSQGVALSGEEEPLYNGLNQGSESSDEQAIVRPHTTLAREE